MWICKAAGIVILGNCRIPSRVYDRARWTQRTFPYQAECLQWTNEHYLALSAGDRVRVDTLVQGTGVEAMLSLT